MDKFVEENREEIEKCAYHIYQMRARFGQSDTPLDNWNRAMEIVRERCSLKKLKK